LTAKSSKIWFRTDHAEDVLASVRHAYACLKLADSDPGAWKWLVLSLHSALQGGCVCYLTTTAEPIGALTERSTINWLNFFEKSRIDVDVKPPQTRLASLPELLERIKRPNDAGEGTATSEINISQSELRDLNFLHSTFRNQFTHFAPMNWSIEISGLLLIVPVVTRIIRDIQSYGWAFRHQDGRWNLELLAMLNAVVEQAEVSYLQCRSQG